ncbi:MAG: DNA (cytosine-5-)-methyltransferase [Ruminococcus sp.]|nr:DNA (cytosine-5-)-methyltransferase [Ruminococcus sp.]
MINLATVFSGIGAPEEAFRQLGLDFHIIFACDNGERELKKSYDEIMLETDGLSSQERIKYVNKLYEDTKKVNYVKQSYFANHEITEDRWYEDVRFIDGTQYREKVDILIGGSPCQSFSTYGKKQGLEDTRGTLFFHYASLIRDIQPLVFIYENVVGLKTHDSGRTWEKIKEVFEDLEYKTFPMILNSVDYGLPQNRNRIFVVGFRNDLNIEEFTTPEPIELTTKAKDYLSPNVDLKYYLGKKGFEWVTTPAKHQSRTRANRDIIGCQTANQQFNWIGDMRLETPTEEMRNNENIYVGEYEGKELVARKMTPDECLRLMGFENFNIVVNDKNAYRQSGNSIAVPVMKALISKICDTVDFE